MSGLKRKERGTWTGKEPSILEESLFKEERLSIRNSAVLAVTVELFRTTMAKFQF